MLTELFSLTVIVAAFAATIHICLCKWGLCSLYDFYKLPWMPERCIFCWNFWLCAAVLCIATFYLPYGCSIILLAFPSASLANKIQHTY